MLISNTALKEEIEALRAEVASLGASVRSLVQLLGPAGVTYPDGSVLVQSIFGTKYLIDPTDLVIGPQLMIYRQWEPELSQMLHAAATPDTVFVDVGASFGYFTCLLGGVIGNRGKGRIFAIEPNPQVIQLLRKNCQINWSMCPISILACAASDNPGKAEFIVPPDRAANATLATPGTRSAPGASESKMIEVQVKRLDDIVPEGMAVDIMKIDVEGHEWGALGGAARVIAQSPNLNIIMEWSLGQMEAAGHSAADMMALFDKLGLMPCALPQDLVIAHARNRVLSREVLAATTYDNIVLVRR